MDLLLRLGFEISPGKVVHPCQKLTFLDIQIDTVVLELSLPHEKLTETKLFVSEFLGCRRATKRQLQQLAGKLNWASRVLYGARTFLRCIIDLINSLTSSNAKPLLTQDFHFDLYWWHQFLQVFNGKRHFFEKLPVIDVQTDDCVAAVGVFFRGDWVYSLLGADFLQYMDLHINYKEAFAIFLLLSTGVTSGKTVMLLFIVITKPQLL